MPPRDPAVVTLVAHLNSPPEVTATGLADTSTGRPVDELTTLHLCSMAKLVTAVAVLRLVQTRALSLDQDVRELVAVPVAAEAGRAPTLRELLAHAGGVQDPVGSFEPGPRPAPRLVDVIAGRTAAHPGPIRVTQPPGRGFAYSDAGYCLLERVVEVAVGAPFAVAAHRLVVAPLGLSSSAFWNGSPAGDEEDDDLRAVLTRVITHAASGHDPDGARLPAGRQHYAGLAASGLWASAADLAVLLTDLGRSWSGDAAVLLDGSTATAMLQDSTTPGVGLGVFLLPARRGVCVMSQGWGTGFQGQARVYPADRGALAVITNANPGVDQGSSVVGRTMRQLATERRWAAPPSGAPALS